MLPEQAKYYQEAEAAGYDLNNIYDPWNDTPEKRRARAEKTIAQLNAEGMKAPGGRNWTIGSDNTVITDRPFSEQEVQQIYQKAQQNGAAFKSNANSLLNSHLSNIMSGR